MATSGPPCEVPLEQAVAGAVSRRVLVAEDNFVNQRLVVGILEKRGHFVTVAENGRKALEALEKGTFDLILMDVQMPEMDGLELTGVIRNSADKPYRNLPVIALTAHAMKGDRDRFLAAGMDDYLAKPLNAPELILMVEQKTPPLCEEMA